MNDTTNHRGTSKRTNEPIFWGLFGVGGMFSAICAPALFLSLLLLYPYFGSGDDPALFYKFINTFFGRLLLALFISLTAWYGLHRIVHCLHDLKAWTAGRARLCYGAALLITVLSLISLFKC
ncbi:MAG: fumarate reductase subunit D [Desulfovibrio sp.]|jgi:fumarate reductase subunit D|nr:fumarate reductase subunit D [Desulfovibrio sp.]